jgi:hypothetical protein
LQLSEHTAIDACFDEQHKKLIRKISTSLDAQRREKKSGMSEDAQCTLRAWYNQHAEHPYPSNDAYAALAQTTSLPVGKVKKWFANRRRRHNDVKPIQEVVARRRSSNQLSRLS